MLPIRRVYVSPKRKREDSETRHKRRLANGLGIANELRGSFDDLTLAGKRRSLVPPLGGRLGRPDFRLARSDLSPMSMLRQDDRDVESLGPPRASRRIDEFEQSPPFTSRSDRSDISMASSVGASMDTSGSPFAISPASTTSPANTTGHDSLLLHSGGGSSARRRKSSNKRFTDTRFNPNAHQSMVVQGVAAMPKRSGGRIRSGERRRAVSSPGTMRKKKGNVLDYNGIVDIDLDMSTDVSPVSGSGELSKYDDDQISPGVLSARSASSRGSLSSSRLNSPPPLIALRTPSKPVWNGPAPCADDDDDDDYMFGAGSSEGKSCASDEGHSSKAGEPEDSAGYSGPQSSSSRRTTGRPTPESEAFKVTPQGRPTPAMEAFERKSTPSREKGPQCPPTPVRTPTWAHSSVVGGGHSPGAHEHRSSLDGTKLLFASSSYDEQEVTSDDFQKISRLGQGSSSEVFKCRNVHDDKLYAVKISKRQFRSKRDRENYLNEVQIFKPLGASCPHILHYHRAWQENGHFYIQYEYCARGDLQSFLEDIAQPLKDDMIWGLVVDIVAGLNHIHMNKLVHLDIKPSNIFITSDGTLKIGDFGMVTKVGSSEHGREGDSVYMAPELLSSSHVKSPANDIFSFGIMLWEILFGCEPPQDGEMWHALRNDRVPRPDGKGSEELFHFVKSLLSSDPSKRPTAFQIMKMPRVIAASQIENSWILNVPKKKKHRFPAHLQLGRSDSFVGSSTSIAPPFDMEDIMRQREGLCTPKDQPVNPNWM